MSVALTPKKVRGRIHFLMISVNAQAPTDATLPGKYVSLEKLCVEKHGSDLWLALCGPEADPEQFSYLPFGPFDEQEQFYEWLSNRLTKARQFNYA